MHVILNLLKYIYLFIQNHKKKKKKHLSKIINTNERGGRIY